jgi:hypothetical protein
MVGCRDNGDQDKGRVSKTNKEIKDLPESTLAHLSMFESAAEHAGMVDDSHADAEGIAKVHRRHGSELVDKLSAHPDTLGVVVAYGVKEAVLLGEEAGWHAGVNNESHEGAEVRKGQGATGGRKCVKGRCDIVVPADEAVNVSLSLERPWMKNTDPTVPGM